MCVLDGGPDRPMERGNFLEEIRQRCVTYEENTALTVQKRLN